jgi:16S rRNA (cytidine1402-2'-O)-methyltransferase
MRLLRTLKDCITYLGAERQCCVSRELSKKFEENKRGTLQHVYDHFNAKTIRGEIVIVIEGNR